MSNVVASTSPLLDESSDTPEFQFNPLSASKTDLHSPINSKAIIIDARKQYSDSVSTAATAAPSQCHHSTVSTISSNTSALFNESRLSLSIYAGNGSSSCKYSNLSLSIPEDSEPGTSKTVTVVSNSATDSVSPRPSEDFQDRRNSAILNS